MSYRITDTPTYTVTGYQHTNDCTTWTPINPNAKHLQAVSLKEKRGKEISGYYAKLKAGALLPYTSYNYLTVEGTSEGDRDVQHNTYPCAKDRYEFWSYYTSWVIDRSSFTPYAQECQALQPALVQACAAQQASAGFDAGTFLAELHKTVALFKNVLSRLLTLAASGKLGSAWLEGRYGWRQILFDIEAANEAIEQLSSNDTFTRNKSRMTASRSWTDTRTFTNPYSSTGEIHRINISDSIEATVVGSMVADHRPSAIYFSPISTAWELVPFSFVIDWVVSVGSWLDSLSFLSTSVNHVQAAGYKISIHRTFESYVETQGSLYTSNTWQNAECDATLIDRTPAQVTLSPLFNLRLDGFKIMDLVALVLQKLGGK